MTRSLLFLALLAALGGALGGQTDLREQHAQGILRRADEKEERGDFQHARQLYEKLVEEYSDTRAAAVAREKAKDGRILRRRLLYEGGPSENRVDVVVMGDGFSVQNKKQEVFDGMAKRVCRSLLLCKTFKEYRSYFNVHALNLSSKEEGVDGHGREYDTALDAKSSGGSQGQVTVDHRLVFKFLREVPHQDNLAIVLVRLGSLGTGGGGVAVIGGEAGGTVVHEFGHAFGGLGDEYTSFTGHRRGARGPNVSSTPDPEKVPWRHWLGKSRKVGIYEGANGQAKGAWRPQVRGCVMGSGGADFCVVCREQIVKRIYAVVSPIDGASPEARRLRLGAERLELSVTPMRPRTHELEVAWRLERVGASAPEPDVDTDAEGGGRQDRYGRPQGQGRMDRRHLPPRFRRLAKTGGEAPLAGDPLEARARKGRSVVTLDRDDLEPGFYRVTVEVRDTTPWVLKDDRRLLAERHTWEVVVE